MLVLISGDVRGLRAGEGGDPRGCGADRREDGTCVFVSISAVCVRRSLSLLLQQIEQSLISSSIFIFNVQIPQPIEVIKNVQVPVPVETIREVEQLCPMEYTVEQTLQVQRPVTVPEMVSVPVPVEQIVEKVVHVPVERIIRRQVLLLPARLEIAVHRFLFFLFGIVLGWGWGCLLFSLTFLFHTSLSGSSARGPGHRARRADPPAGHPARPCGGVCSPISPKSRARPLTCSDTPHPQYGNHSDALPFSSRSRRSLSLRCQRSAV